MAAQPHSCVLVAKQDSTLRSIGSFGLGPAQMRITLTMMDIKAIAIGAVMFGLLVIVPMIAILTEHQRKMAKIVRGQQDTEEKDRDQVIIGLHADIGNRKVNKGSADGQVLDELRAMRGELADLRMQVAQLQGVNTPPPLSEDLVRTRLSQGN